MKALVAVSASGVRVKVLVDKDAQGWRWSGRFADLLRVGASVYRVDDTCPFPCHAVVDADWSGLALDGWGAKLGEGIELVVLDSAFAASPETSFHLATSHAEPLRDRLVST